MLDNNIRTYRGRKAVSYLQRDEAVWKDYSSSESTEQNCLASWWNHCTLNVHRIIKPDTKLSYTSKLRFAPASEVICIEEAKGNKNTVCSLEDGKTWLQMFFLILYFDLCAELPLASKVVLYVDQKGRFWPSNGYCDAQLWLLKLLSVLKLARVSHIHQVDLYLQLVVPILASFLPFFWGRGHMMNF